MFSDQSEKMYLSQMRCQEQRLPARATQPIFPGFMPPVQNCMLAPAMVAGFICIFNIGSNALLVHYYGFVVRQSCHARQGSGEDGTDL